MLSPFQWGKGGRALTPEDVARERELVALARAKMGDTSPVAHWSQGATRVVDALGGVLREKRTNKAEDAGMSGADAYIANNPVLSALIGGGGMPAAPPSGGSASPAPAFTPDPSDALAADAMSALGKINPSDRDILAKTLMAEAGGEGYGGMLAAGAVIDNRRKGGGYGDGWNGVIMKPGQFSAWNGVTGYAGGEGALNMSTMSPSEEAYAAADAILTGNYEDPTGGATHYYNPNVANPKWGQSAGGDWTAIGNHVFGSADAGRGGSAPQGGGMSASGQPVTMSGGGANVTAALAAAMSDPWVAKKYGPVLEALMGQDMKRSDMQYQAQLAQSDPMYQAQLAAQQLELDKMRNPGAPAPIEVGGVLLDPTTFQPIFDSRAPAAGDGGFTLGQGQQRFDANGNLIASVDAPPPDPTVPTTKNVTLADGSEALVQWNPETAVWDPAPIPQGGTSGAGLPTTKLTESQARITLFETLQNETAPVLTQIESIWDPANISDAVARSTPIAGNFFTTEEGQMYASASSAWAEGALRISTGAAATEPEIQRIQKTYFAQPGDTPAVVEFKRGMRDMYDRAIQASLGKDTSGQGSLVLPEEFAKAYTSANPPPAALPVPGGNKTASGVEWSIAP